jgi:predicted nuclease of predicted toxin-antitoxin system
MHASPLFYGVGLLTAVLLTLDLRFHTLFTAQVSKIQILYLRLIPLKNSKTQRTLNFENLCVLYDIYIYFVLF